jgi:hypothetical protein
MAVEPGVPAGTTDNGRDKPRAAFLSHSSEDEELAREICAALEEKGFACWFAPRDCVVGQPYASECLLGVAASKSLVLLASEKALHSVQVRSEVEQAHKRNKQIYTVLIPPNAQGKLPKLPREMDYYLSRWSWMKSPARNADEIAAMLAKGLEREGAWKGDEEGILPPSVRRTMHYRPMAFAKLVAAVAFGLLLILGGVTYALNRRMDLDFRRLGYVVLAAEPADGGRATLGHAQIWLMAKGVRFADVRLKMAIETTDGGVRQQEFSEWPAPEQVGSDEEAAIPLGPGVRQLTTCLIVPNSGLNAPYRVTQRFLMTPQPEEIRVAETAEKEVSREDGSPCAVGP